MANFVRPFEKLDCWRCRFRGLLQIMDYFLILFFFYPRMDGLYFCHSCCIDVYLSFICSSIQEPAQGNWQQVKLFIYALSFYRSKMILDRPNCFGRVQIVLVGSKSFWLGPNHFGQVQIRFFWTNFYNLDLTKMVCTRPKRICPVQNHW